MYIMDLRRNLLMKSIILLDKIDKDKGYHDFSIMKIGVKSSSVVNKS